MVGKESPRKLTQIPQTIAQDFTSKKTLWTPNFNIDPPNEGRRLRSTFRKSGMWTQVHLPWRKLTMEKKLPMKRKLLKKKSQVPGLGHLWKCSPLFWREEEERDNEVPWYPSIPLNPSCACSTHRVLWLVFPGFKKPLTKSSGNVVRNFPGLTQQGKG